MGSGNSAAVPVFRTSLDVSCVQQALSSLCKMLRVGHKLFAVAGTKDKRGVTAQQVGGERRGARSRRQAGRSPSCCSRHPDLACEQTSVHRGLASLGAVHVC